MEKQIIIINGSGGSGKDTFVSFCSEYKKVLNVSSIDKVREAANILIDWDGVKDEKYRKLLVDLKRLSMEYNDAPTKYILSKAEEMDKTKKLLGAKTLLISNPSVPIITSNESDRKVNEYNYDYTILNDGSLEDLKEKAKDFIGGLYGNIA